MFNIIKFIEKQLNAIGILDTNSNNLEYIHFDISLIFHHYKYFHQ
jgi:hypothetical protein